MMDWASGLSISFATWKYSYLRWGGVQGLSERSI